MKDTVTLTGLWATGYHGVFPYERRDGQIFVVDAACELARPSSGDDLATTVNYAELADGIVAIITGEPVDLIETVAERVAALCVAHPLVAAATVTVHKPQAPIGHTFGDVSVTLRREAPSAGGVR